MHTKLTSRLCRTACRRLAQTSAASDEAVSRRFSSGALVVGALHTAGWCRRLAGCEVLALDGQWAWRPLAVERGRDGASQETPRCTFAFRCYLLQSRLACPSVAMLIRPAPTPARRGCLLVIRGVESGPQGSLMVRSDCLGYERELKSVPQTEIRTVCGLPQPVRLRKSLSLNIYTHTLGNTIYPQ